MNWQLIKKIIILKCRLLLFYSTADHFSSGLWYVTKSVFYTTGVGQLSGWTKKKLQSISQSQTWTKKRSWSLFGGLLPVWSTTAFQIHYNLSETITSEKSAQQIDKMHQNCNACNWHSPTDRTQFYSMKMLDCRLKNKHFKSWTNWATKFYLICHSHLISCQSTITSSSISMSFCRENAPTTNRRHKMLSKSSSNPKVWIFMLQE